MSKPVTTPPKNDPKETTPPNGAGDPKDPKNPEPKELDLNEFHQKAFNSGKEEGAKAGREAALKELADELGVNLSDPEVRKGLVQVLKSKEPKKDDPPKDDPKPVDWKQTPEGLKFLKEQREQEEKVRQYEEKQREDNLKNAITALSKKYGGTNEDQIFTLLRYSGDTIVKWEDDRVKVQNTDGTDRIDPKTKQPMTIDAYVQAFITANTHLRNSQTSGGAGTTSQTKVGEEGANEVVNRWIDKGKMAPTITPL